MSALYHYTCDHYYADIVRCGQGGGLVIIFLFLAMLATSLAVGGWLAAHLTRTSARVDGWVADDARGQAVCDEAANAETACDWGGSI